MKPFRNAGWELYDKLVELNPSSRAKGTHVYSPLMSTLTSTQSEIDESSTGPFTMTSSNAPGSLFDFPIDKDHYNNHGVATDSTNNQSTRVLTSGVAAGKRKATDEGPDDCNPNVDMDEDIPFEHSHSSMGPPSVRPSNHRGSSAASQADSGNAESSKRRKASKPAKSTEVATSMKSSRAQATSSKQDVMGPIQMQQFFNASDSLTTVIRDSIQLLGQDPIAERARQVAEVLSNHQFGFTPEEKVAMLNGFSVNPAAQSMFLGLSQDFDTQRMYAVSVMEAFRRSLTTQ